MTNGTENHNILQTGVLSPSGTGYLIVNVFTARGAIPLENAAVLIKGIEEFGQSEVLYTLRTDACGATEKVSLAAPSASESLTPRYPAPYAIYNIKIYKAGYYPSEDINVPLFENVTSIQCAELISVC